MRLVQSIIIFMSQHMFSMFPVPYSMFALSIGNTRRSFSLWFIRFRFKNLCSSQYSLLFSFSLSLWFNSQFVSL